MTKDFSIAQLNGGLDTRSADGSCGVGWFRGLLNVDGGEIFSMCALGGWRRRGYLKSCVNNDDLVDQLQEAQVYGVPFDYTVPGYQSFAGIAYPNIYIYNTFASVDGQICYGSYLLGNVCREAVTFMKSVTSVSGSRRLLAGTASRLYVSDDAGGSWRIIADGLGGACSPDSLCSCSDIRMMAATLGNFSILTNGIDQVLQWQFDTGPEGCFGWSADYVSDLRYLNVSSAQGVTEFGGLIILWDVRMDNENWPSRILWSDFNNPTSWIPGGESIAGFNDFGLGERIISVMPISGSIRIFTNQAIYRGVIVPDSRTFAFTEVYRLKGGQTSNLPAFKNGIANAGSYHIWVSQQEVFAMAEYDTQPILLDWLHRASGVIFNGLLENWVCAFPDLSSKLPINRNACDQLICRWSGKERCVIISWPTGENVCPDLSLILWPENKKATIVDYGFTEVAEHQPDIAESWRDFMGRIGLCDPAQFLLPKEGLSCPTTFVEVTYSGLWNETEDTSLPMAPDSWAALFCDVCMADLCKLCEADTTLLLASASDKTIKEFTPNEYVREELVSQTDELFPEPDLGTYQLNPYTVMMQSDAQQPMGPAEVTFRAMLIGYTVGDTGSPPTVCAQVGGGWSPGCLEWETAGGVLLECGGANPTKRQGRPARFGFMTTGAWFAWRFSTTATEFCAINLNYRIEVEGGCW